MKKEFDCVEMKREIQAQIWEEIKDLTDEQRTEYFLRHAETGPFAEHWREIPTIDDERRERERRRHIG